MDFKISEKQIELILKNIAQHQIKGEIAVNITSVLMQLKPIKQENKDEKKKN